MFEILVIYLSLFYLFFGIIFLLIPITYTELSRPRDLIKGSTNLIIGMLLIVKNNVFDDLYSLVLIFITTLFILYFVEIFSIRWNQQKHIQKINNLSRRLNLKKNIVF